ncbi:MAG: GAK system ATP-grasp enzyme [Longimicrobiales bacterium]
MPRIGVIGNPDGWSTRHLAQRVEERFGSALLVDAGRMTLDTEAGTVFAAGQDLSDLDGLIVKKIGAGYRPEHLDRLEILRLLEHRGVRVFSPAERIIRVLDRLACTVTLAQAGAPLAPTVVTEELDEARAAVRRFGRVVAKPLWTSKARGMEVLDAEDEGLEYRLRSFHENGNPVMYLQKHLHLPGKDLGVVFLGGEYVGTYARLGAGDSWSTAVRGPSGKYGVHDPEPGVVEMAHRAQAPFGLDFTCVDVAETSEGTVVWEVSAFGGFRGLLEARDIDAGTLYAEYVARELGA